MKKFLAVFALLFVSTFVFAAGGTFADFVEVVVNGTSWWRGTGESNPNFNGTSFGNLAGGSTLVLRTRGLKTWEDNSTVVLSARLNLRVYKQGETAPAFTVIPLANPGGKVGNNREWILSAPDINLLSGVASTGTYNIEIFWDATTNGTNSAVTLYRSNSGANYIATFTADAVLSAELTQFTAVPQANSVLLSWATASEMNNSHFEVERSTDARTWAKVGEVKGNGSKNTESNYTFTDAQPTTGINYYRLKQVDTDGKFAYHKVVSVVMGKGSKVTIAPNPAHEQLQILGATEGGEASIFNVSGQLMMMVKNTTTLNISALPSGVYQLRYQSENGETTLSRFVKQ